VRPKAGAFTVNGEIVTRRRIIAIFVPLLAVISIAAGTAAATTGSHPAVHVATSPAARPAAPPEVFNCQRAQVRPGSFTLTCADGNDYLSHLTWSSWTAASATGTGTEMVNNCQPYCAAGKFVSYPADVTFWRSEPASGHPGQHYFSRVTLRFPGARPPAFSHGKPVAGPKTWTSVLPGPAAPKPGQLS
jgi:hypothetical protein